MAAIWRYAIIAWSVAVTLPAQAQTLEAVIGGEPHQLERVADMDSRQQGLMGRSMLAPATGMLFDFPLGTRPAIWMRNMRIALDLLFVDEQAQLVQVFTEVPPCTELPCAVYQADQPLRFVIELPAGSAQRLQLKIGERLDLGGLEQSPPPAS